MKRLTSISATSSATPNRHHHHHHHHHSHSFSYSNNNTNKERLFPLHRSITEDDKYQNTHVSPITKFVCKLLGLAGPSSSSSTISASSTTRPKSWHKSRSTTSITKSSVTSSYQHTTLHACSSAEIAAEAASAAATTTPRKPTAITIVTPKPCTLTASIMEWDHQQPTKEDDVISVSSSESSSTSTSGTMHSSISSISNTKTTSAAVDALVIASLLPSSTTATAAATVTKTRSTDEFDDMPSIHLIGRQFDIDTAVLTEGIAEMVRPYIPRRYRIAQKWNLLYSLDQHGVSLATLYSCMKNFEGPCIMIIKDAQNQIFGSYLSHPFSSQSHYYGTGECFLWKLNQQQEPQPKIKVFPWTGKNDYMMLSDSDFIAIGGGDGKFGLWLNSELEKGYSSTCPTFDNEILALQPEFQCMEMEVWGLCI
ncbi:TLD-domain-containing protein [Mucor ambiguus]|uniref:Oxidation resistance protein 1 n=1 Tax=Mucor ambiguus TaxID=91626 RepID=A0A0C9MA67_9FUNG|nr:TLD-domain-containing protein [Mucor ambiguus]